MKKWLIVTALVAALGATPARAASTGNWISYLEITGCTCAYGSFSPSATAYKVDESGPQGAVGTSKSPITVNTGNQTQTVQVAFTVNGTPVASTTAPSGQQGGVYFTSAPIDLTPGSNLVTITTSDPSHHLNPTVVTVTVPYHPAVLANTSPPAATSSPLACSPGSWQSDPANPTLIVSWEGSVDGQTWAQPTGQSRYVRCKVTASNRYASASAYSAPVGVGAAAGTQAPASTSASTTVQATTATTTAAAKTPAPPTTSVAVTPATTVQAKPAAKPKAKVWLKVRKPTKPTVVHRYDLRLLS